MTPRWTVPELENIESAKGLPAYITRRLRSGIGPLKQTYNHRYDGEYSATDFYVAEGKNEGLVLSMFCTNHENSAIKNKDGSTLESLKITVSSGPLGFLSASYFITTIQVDRTPSFVETMLKNIISLVDDIANHKAEDTPWEH